MTPDERLHIDSEKVDARRHSRGWRAGLTATGPSIAYAWLRVVSKPVDYPTRHQLIHAR